MSRPTVIHIRTAPKGWESNPAYVYIGRAGKGQSGDFGNPFQVGHFTLAEALTRYAIYLEHRLKTDPVFREKVKQLSGKTLVCFCKPHDCHGDILASWCEYLNQN